jgi:integrase
MKVRKRTWVTRSGEEHIAWVADYFAPSADGTKRRYTKTFKTKREANAWLAHTVVEIRQGVHTPAHLSPTVLEAGEHWIAQAETDGLERSTVVCYRQLLDCHIRPYLGHVKLAELTPGAVQSFRTVLIRNGRSRGLADRVVSSLGSILAGAMAAGRVSRNVVREAAQHNRRRARIESRHRTQLQVGVDIPTKDEIRAMLAHAGRLRPLLITAIFTGLRASELRGLTWENVDLDRQVLTVRQRADRWCEMGSPKSAAAKREIPLAPIVVNTLRQWRLECPRFAGELRLVFPNGKGEVEWLPNIHRRMLGPVQFAAGISAAPHSPKYSMHAFRHAAASLFIEQGFSPKRVQALMGHSTIAMTLDTYTHLWPSEADDQAAMSQLQARLLVA